MAKKAATKAKTDSPFDLIRCICHTQGIGSVLAESIAAKLTAEQKAEIERLATAKASGIEILNALGKPADKVEEPEDKPA